MWVSRRGWSTAKRQVGKSRTHLVVLPARRKPGVGVVAYAVGVRVVATLLHRVRRLEVLAACNLEIVKTMATKGKETGGVEIECASGWRIVH